MHRTLQYSIVGLAGIGLVASAILSSCSPRGGGTVLPEGEQMVKGTLEPVELSIVRRGTHLLLQEGKGIYYVESSAVGLRAFEGKDVTIRGTLQENTDPSFLPVLSALEVFAETGAVRSWHLPALKMTLEAPDEWVGTMNSGSLVLSESGSGLQILAIERLQIEELPSGTPMNVGGFSARETQSGSGETMVTVDHRGMKIRFTLQADELEPERMDDFLLLLKSVHFDATSAARSATASGKTGTGSAKVGQPCGGAAGILCPAGSYCEITDMATNTGNCRAR